jgi:streptogramin lyase
MTSQRLWPLASLAALALLVAAPRGAQAQEIYVSSSSTNSIIKVSPTGVRTTFASTGLSQPFGVAFAASRDLFVANAGNNTISKISPAGVVSRVTLTGGTLRQPFGIAFAPNGDLYVANYASGVVGAGSVSKISPTGVVSTFASGLTGPTELAFDSLGNLYVSNFAGRVLAGVYRITPAGVASSFISSSQTLLPCGLAFSGADLYVMNYSNGRLLRKPPTTATTLFSSNTALVGGMGLRAWGNSFFLTNMDRGTILKVTPVAGGTPTITTHATGLGNPVGLAIAP